MNSRNNTESRIPLENDLKRVVEGGFCIGCGACALVDSAIQIQENEYGQYQAALPEKTEPLSRRVCPFASDDDESVLAEKAFVTPENTLCHDDRAGYYRNIYGGHVAQAPFRSQGSSGGLVTWVLVQLLRQNKIDGVLHVGANGQSDELFEYSISYTEDEILSQAKSRYYPVHMDKVLRDIRDKGKRYALVGLPCFIKASRLLAQEDERIDQSIVFRIAIFCGHLKSKAYAEMIGWQQGIPPGQLKAIDFRVKDPNRPANQYQTQVKGVDRKGRTRLRTSSIRGLWGLDWGMGWFKPKACDWCDDIAGETADLACGDAWLPEFVHESMGSNIVVVRHPVLDELLQQGILQGKLTLKQQGVDQVYQSQAANYRHRVEGLSFRISRAQQDQLWYPKKRVAADTYSLSEEREALYLMRERLAEDSHKHFREAKKHRSLGYFILRMLPYELSYYRLNRHLFRGAVKKAYQLTVQCFRSFF